MKRLLFTMSFFLLLLPAMANKGKKYIGANLSFGTKVESMGIGIKAQHYFDEPWRGEAGIDKYFESNGVDMWDLYANVHYVYPINREVRVYPLAGLTFANWGVAGAGRSSHLALNFGVGGEYSLSPQWNLTMELKAQATNHNSQGIMAIGVTYRFK